MLVVEGEYLIRNCRGARGLALAGFLLIYHNFRYGCLRLALHNSLPLQVVLLLFNKEERLLTLQRDSKSLCIYVS